MSISQCRTKCSMLIYELEQALGNYVIESTSSISDSEIAKTIGNRCGIHRKEELDENKQKITQESYFSEILSLAIYVSEGSSDNIQIKRIEKIMNDLSIFDIRNAISHPNREFPDYFWYRSATLACDPCVEQLGFNKVLYALINAEQDKIQEPPEDWIHNKRWIIPTSLPELSEHEITGLVGRNKDLAVLERELKSRKNSLVAVIARGGIGKTSLIYEVLTNLSSNPDIINFYEGIIWCSLKQEKLTAKGVETLNAPASIEELKNNIISKFNNAFNTNSNNFPDLINTFSESKILLAIDNLETLLRDDPNDFNDFYDLIPDTWKVLVTSRITVDGAKNISLNPLDISGATSLLRNYLNALGHKPPLSDILENICKECEYNPLAIRISADLYAAGGDFNEIINKTKNDILSFSFSSLLDLLSKIEGNILEVIFALTEPSRSDICSVLQIDIDLVAESIAKLGKTSLINRLAGHEVEKYELGSSVRELLRARPQNVLIREMANKWIANNSANLELQYDFQKEKNIYPTDLYFLPLNSTAQEASLLKKLIVAKNENTALLQIETQAKTLLTTKNQSSFLYRVLGRVYHLLNDDNAANEHYIKAINLNAEDPAPRFALVLMRVKNYPKETFEHIDYLMKNGWGTSFKSGEFHANKISSLYLHICNICEKFEEVFTYTTGAEELVNNYPHLAIQRASAYRRLLDKETTEKGLLNDRVEQMLSKSAALLTKVINYHGLHINGNKESAKLTQEILHYKNRGFDFYRFSDENFEIIKNFLLTVLRQSNYTDRYELRNDLGQALSIFNSSSLSDDTTESSIKEFEAKGYIICRVKPGIKSTFFFVRDQNDVDYYVKNIYVKAKNPDYFLVPGLLAAVKCENTNQGLAAIECILID
jgi:hypothetical protein